MSGNVWEWCEDLWHSDYQDAPKDGSARTQGKSSNRVIRGGSWYYFAEGCRTANRFGDDPDYRSYDVGFRLVFVP